MANKKSSKKSAPKKAARSKPAVYVSPKAKEQEIAKAEAELAELKKPSPVAYPKHLYRGSGKQSEGRIVANEQDHKDAGKGWLDSPPEGWVADVNALADKEAAEKAEKE